MDALLQKAASGQRMPREEEEAYEVLEALLFNRDRLPFPGEERFVKFDFRIDRKGIISVFSWGELYSAFDGLDVTRFRQCDVCKAPFYAPREDSRGCSEKHTSTLRQRDYRKTKGDNE